MELDQNYSKLKLDISRKIKPDNPNYTYNFIEPDIVEIYDNQKLVLTANYQYIGLYIDRIWTWAWNNPYVNKKLVSSKIITYKAQNNQLIDYFIQHGNFYATPETVELIIKLALYITNALWYFKINQSEYIYITKIIQY